MSRVVKQIEVPGTFEFNDVTFVRVMFIFEEHPTEVINVEHELWRKILDDSKLQAAHVSWNELKNQIYYSCVMQTHERVSDFNI